ncbi:MAG: hypothetical protein KAI24_10240 [Planctomycetes bacterium]|nr:hypothetical protein [Planctomycetota bacterium]
MPAVAVIPVLLAASLAAVVPDPPDWAKDLGVAFEDVAPITAGVPAGMHMATAKMPAKDGKTQPAVLVCVPLAGPLTGCRFVGAFSPDGAVLANALWGNAEFDDDPTLRWSMYLHTLREAHEDRPRALLDDEVPAPPKPGADPVGAFLLRQSRVMQQNVVFERQLKVLGRGGKALTDPRPAAAIAAEMRALARSAALGDVFGADGATRYREHTERTASALDRIAAIDPKQDGAAARMLEVFKSASCTRCHKDRLGDDGATFRKGIGQRRRALAQIGELRVGVDLARVPGEADDARSQAVADGFRAALRAVHARARR